MRVLSEVFLCSEHNVLRNLIMYMCTSLCLWIMTYLRIFNESSRISNLSYTCIFARQGFVQKQSLNTFIYQGTVSLRHIWIFRNWFFVDHYTPRFYQNFSCSMFIIIIFFRFSDLGNIIYTSINLNCGFIFTIFFKMQVLTCLQGIWLYSCFIKLCWHES